MRYRAEGVSRAGERVYFGRVVRVRDDQFDRHRPADVILGKIEHAAGERVDYVVYVAVRYVSDRVHEKDRIRSGVIRIYERKVVFSVRSVKSERSAREFSVKRNSVIAGPSAVVSKCLRRGFESREQIRGAEFIDRVSGRRQSAGSVDELFLFGNGSHFIDGGYRKDGNRHFHIVGIIFTFKRDGCRIGADAGLRSRGSGEGDFDLVVGFGLSM